VAETCEHCKKDLGDQRAVACSTCGTPHHQECWRAASGCAAQDCEGGRPVKFKAVRVDDDEVADGDDTSDEASADAGAPEPESPAAPEGTGDDGDTGIDVTFGPKAVGPLVLHVEWGTPLWWGQVVGAVLAGAGVLLVSRFGAAAAVVVAVGLAVTVASWRMRAARRIETAFDPDKKLMLRRAGPAVPAADVTAETSFREIRFLRIENADDDVPSWSRTAFMASLAVLGLAGFVYQVFRPDVHPATVILGLVGVVLFVLGCPWFLHFLTASRQPVVMISVARDGSTTTLCDPILTPEERKQVRAMVTRLENGTSLRFKGAEKVAAKLR